LNHNFQLQVLKDRNRPTYSQSERIIKEMHEKDKREFIE